MMLLPIVQIDDWRESEEQAGRSVISKLQWNWIMTTLLIVVATYLFINWSDSKSESTRIQVRDQYSQVYNQILTEHTNRLLAENPGADIASIQARASTEIFTNGIMANDPRYIEVAKMQEVKESYDGYGCTAIIIATLLAVFSFITMYTNCRREAEKHNY